MNDLPDKDLARALQAPVRDDLDRGRACPDLGAGIDLATGALPKERADALFTHAAFCSSCLGRLRTSKELFSREASVAETADVGQFAAASAEWQRRLAAEPARKPHQRRPGRQTWFIWSGAGLAAAFALVLAFFL